MKSWYTIEEYSERTGASISRIRRQIREGRLKAKKFGQDWFLKPADSRLSLLDEDTDPNIRIDRLDSSQAPSLYDKQDKGNVRSVVEFSSKALNHYLLLSEKLIAEKDLRLAERDDQLRENKQAIAELEGYVKMLEEEIVRLKERPEGWR